MLRRISTAMEAPGRIWCKLMHGDPMWPIHGYYLCRECLRQYPVQWESPVEPASIPVQMGARPESVGYGGATPVPVLSNSHPRSQFATT